MAKFLPALPHGAIEPAFDDVWQVTGGFRFMPGFVITRNMQIIRQGEELLLVNSVRLTGAGEAELAKLGKVTHVVRLGGFHGADDPYFAHRYGATMWAPKGITSAGGPSYRELGETTSPLKRGKVFLFQHGRGAEAALVLDVAGGVLVTCDAYQNWTTFDGCSWLGRVVMKRMGFRSAHIGGPWAKRMGEGVRKDFDRLLAVEFAHLMPGHGTVLRDRAKQELPGAIARRFEGAK